MAASTTLLDLPSELLLNILEPLPISDCRALAHAFQHPKLQACYRTRTSIPDYLSTHGVDGTALLEALRSSNAMIIGALTLEYFVPGSTNPHSSWTFLVPALGEKAYRSMTFLEHQSALA